MARPNNPSAISAHIQGLREAKAAFQALPEITRDRLNVATETTVSEIARVAKARILSNPSVQTRTLYGSIGYSMNKTNGRGRAGVSNVTTTIRVGDKRIKVKGRIILGPKGDGVAGSRVVRPARYAHLVEFGTVHMKAEPFMMPAVEGEQAHYLARCKEAGKAIEKDMSAIGGRTL